MSPKVKPLSLAIAALISGGAFSALQVSPAFAQAAPSQAGVVGRVEVTGTNIRRTDTETPSEVQVITKEQMIQSGYTSVSQVLRELTANSNGTLSTGFTRAFAAGSSGVSLRGLSVGATLVLIDGYRMAGYPRTDDAQRQFVDLNSIPFVAVERIEILLDGASAIYGSDAIAGVVNVILKKDFKGTNVNVSGGTTTKGGGTTWDAQIMQGFGDINSGLGGYAAFEYRSQEQILLKDRSGERWASMDYTPWGGNDLTQGAKSSNAANPLSRTPYLQARTGSANDPNTFRFLDSNCTFALRNANQCLVENTWGQIQPRSQNVNAVLSVSAKLAQDWMLNVTGSYFNSTSTQQFSPATVNFGSFAGYTTAGPNQLPKIGVNAVPVFTVPTTYPGNTFGAPANVRALIPDGRNRSTNEDVGAGRLVAILTGAGWGWDITATAGYTNVTDNITYNGWTSAPNLYTALNDPVNPYKLTGGNSRELQNFVQPTVHNTNWNNLSFVQASGSRDLMQLQGGPLSLSVGAADVYRNLQSPNAGAGQNGTVGIIGATTYAVGSQNNASVYAELVAPVLKTLEIDAALRYDYYNVPSSNTWNPKVGIKWTPIQQLALRGTAGTGFRAPFITEVGNSGATFNFNSIRDTANCPVSNANGTPNLTSPLNVPTQCVLTPPYLQTSNKNVQAEKSDNFTAGLILEPVRGWSTTFDYYYIKLKGQIINSVQQPDFHATPENTVRGTQDIVTFGDGSTGLSPAGIIAYIASPFINAQQVTTDGFDLSSAYTWKLPDNSNLLTSFTWNHILTYDLTSGGVKSKLAGTHGPTAVGGDTGTPKDRAQATFQWAKGPFTGTATVNYVGRFNVTDPSAGVISCNDGLNASQAARWSNTGGEGAPAYCNVASFTYVNLNLQYALNKQWTLQASAQNLFNAKPPYDFETYGASAGNNANAANTGLPYNPSYHMTGAVGTFLSVGFIYNFN
ncbi:MAG: TonB-dependent receptor [Casimicrobiaceae bacterium]